MYSMLLKTKSKIAIVVFILLAEAGMWFYWLHNVEWAARVAWGEARGEPDEGMHAVLNVMMNRKQDPRFPGTLSAVAKQPYQFSAYNADDPNRDKLVAVSNDDPYYWRAKWMATFAQLGLLWDITDGATYYHSKTVERPDFLEEADISVIIGNHIFYVVE